MFCNRVQGWKVQNWYWRKVWKVCAFSTDCTVCLSVCLWIYSWQQGLRSFQIRTNIGELLRTFTYSWPETLEVGGQLEHLPSCILKKLIEDGNRYRDSPLSMVSLSTIPSILWIPWCSTIFKSHFRKLWFFFDKYRNFELNTKCLHVKGLLIM